jgi:hypothetical protein
MSQKIYHHYQAQDGKPEKEIARFYARAFLEQCKVAASRWGGVISTEKGVGITCGHNHLGSIILFYLDFRMYFNLMKRFQDVFQSDQHYSRSSLFATSSSIHNNIKAIFTGNGIVFVRKRH